MMTPAIERQRDRDQRRQRPPCSPSARRAFQARCACGASSFALMRARPSAGRSSRAVISRGRMGLRQLPARDHGDAVGDLEDLVEVLADHQHRRAGARRDRSAPGGWSAAAPASTPQVGWLTTSTAGLAVDLAADDEFLQVAAGQRARLRIGLALAHVEGLDHPVADRRGAAPRSMTPDCAPARRRAEWRVSTTFSDRRKAGTAPWPSRSSGTKAAPSLRRAVTPRRPQGAPSIAMRLAARRRPLAGERVEQFALAVAGDAGDADDLAAAHLERDVVERDAEGAVGTAG